MKWLRHRMGWAESSQAIDPEELDWGNAEVHEGRKVGVIFRGSNIATYNLQLFAPDQKYGPGEDVPWDEVRKETPDDKRVLADLPAMLEQVEDELEDRLPEGYYIRITEWNK